MPAGSVIEGRVHGAPADDSAAGFLRTGVRAVRGTVLAGLVATATVLGVTGSGNAELPKGLVASPPAEGRYVKTDQGYMVPYTITIPGTDVRFSMEPIAGGTFQMGSSPDAPHHSPDEGPPVQVKVPPFWMGSREVSWAEYKEFMNLYTVFKDFEAQQIRTVTDANRLLAITAPTELYDPSFTFEFGEDDQQPAVTMTQYAAKQYTKWLSGVTGHAYRLPTEAEWEYACRAGSRTVYHFGDDPADLDQYGWYYENSDGQPQKVGTKKPNAWGLHDMHGNVWEWVLDEYFENGYQRLGKGPVKAENAVAWPTKLFPRVVRGGSWDEPPAACRAASKMPSHDTDWKSEDPNLPLSPWWFTSDPSRSVGFRLVRPLGGVPKEWLARCYEADVDAIKIDVEIRLEEGRGVLGLVDEKLPEAIEKSQQ